MNPKGNPSESIEISTRLTSIRYHMNVMLDSLLLTLPRANSIQAGCDVSYLLYVTIFFFQDEDERIRNLGGVVTHCMGAMRVNGFLSISRAIGK